MRKQTYIYAMGNSSDKNLAFFISVTAVITLTVAIIICATSYGKLKISFQSCFYLVCYSVEDNSISADAISDSVTNLGGAGYVFEYGGEYFVTVACYYKKTDAERVQKSLLKRGLQCFVLTAERKEYSLKPGISEKRQKLYAGNLNTLFSLSELCYECANKLDTGEYNQSNAKNVLADVEKSLNGLKLSNSSNCFSEEIKRLSAECEAAGDGYLLSKNLRKLQIAIADTLINIDIY